MSATITFIPTAGSPETIALPAAATLTIEPTLVHQAVVSEIANARAPHGHTKTRAEVSGGGRKPWRQKGTGRARASSIRSPLWAGGGITFGPRSERNFRKQINKPMRMAAFAMALSAKLAAGTVYLMDDALLRHAKTASAARALAKIDKLGIRPLVIFASADDAPIRALRNLAGIQIELASSVSLTRILAATSILGDRSGIGALLARAFAIDLPTVAASHKITQKTDIVEKTVSAQRSETI